VLQGVALLHGQLIAEKSIPLETSSPDKDVALFSVPGVRARHKDILEVLERAGFACKPLLRKPCQLILLTLLTYHSSGVSQLRVW